MVGNCAAFTEVMERARPSNDEARKENDPTKVTSESTLCRRRFPTVGRKDARKSTTLGKKSHAPKFHPSTGCELTPCADICERDVVHANPRHSIVVFLSGANRGSIMFHDVQRDPRVKVASFHGSGVWFGARRVPQLKLCSVISGLLDICTTEGHVLLSDTWRLLYDVVL